MFCGFNICSVGEARCFVGLIFLFVLWIVLVVFYLIQVVLYIYITVSVDDIRCSVVNRDATQWVRLYSVDNTCSMDRLVFP